MNDQDILQIAAVAVISGLVSSIPSYLNKPTRKEVSSMIQKEAPLAVYLQLEEIQKAQKDIQIAQAQMASKIELILSFIKRENRSL